MLEVIKEFMSEHMQFILGFTAGFLALSLRWLRKHPEDWYTVEEIDPDYEVEFEEMYR